MKKQTPAQGNIGRANAIERGWRVTKNTRVIPKALTPDDRLSLYRRWTMHDAPLSTLAWETGVSQDSLARMFHELQQMALVRTAEAAYEAGRKDLLTPPPATAARRRAA